MFILVLTTRKFSFWFKVNVKEYQGVFPFRSKKSMFTGVIEACHYAGAHSKEILGASLRCQVVVITIVLGDLKSDTSRT